ncbi:MAG: hypothetical protein KC449_18140 [Anaerolineales bacterium]|nr:hypothetical protein [Anaerolineales bacterium]
MKIEGDVHGFIDGTFPAVYRSDKNLITGTANSVDAMQSINVEDLAKYFLEGATQQNSESLFRHEKYKTALELYSAFFTETSQNAKFLTLVMVLETLAESKKRPQLVLELLKDFRNQIEELENKLSADSEEFISLDSLKRELTFRQEDSIRKQIRALVYDTLLINGDEDAEETAKLAVKIYDKRSKLVHEGKISQKDLHHASSNARRIVKRILQAKFTHLTQTK